MEYSHRVPGGSCGLDLGEQRPRVGSGPGEAGDQPRGRTGGIAVVLDPGRPGRHREHVLHRAGGVPGPGQLRDVVGDGVLEPRARRRARPGRRGGPAPTWSSRRRGAASPARRRRRTTRARPTRRPSGPSRTSSEVEWVSLHPGVEVTRAAGAVDLAPRADGAPGGAAAGRRRARPRGGRPGSSWGSTKPRVESPGRSLIGARAISRCADCWPGGAWCTPPAGSPSPRPPSRTRRAGPALRICTRAAIERTSARLWVTKSMLMPRLFRSSSSSATIEPCTETSSAEVISSQTSRSGSAARARAIATRWRSPPESRLAWYFSTAGPEGDLVEQVDHPLGRLLARGDAEQLHRPLHDLLDRQARVQRQVGVLEDVLDALAVGRAALPGALRELVALEGDRAGPLLVQAADAARDGGLAAAGLADQGDDLGLADVEGDAVDDLRAAVEDR